MAIQEIQENDLIKDSREVINDNFTELDTLKAPLASPALTGTPTAPTPTAGDDSTKIATTEFVQDEIATNLQDYLPLTGGSVTGNLTVSGSITGNLTGNATNDGNGNPIASTYLPLAGGTMTGDIVRTAGSLAVGSADDGYIQLYGGTGYDHGAWFQLCGKNHTNAGRWSLQANDGSNRVALVGNANGTLTWGGNNVITAAGGTMTGAIVNSDTVIKHRVDTGYIRFDGGSSDNDGATLSLWGDSHTANAGEFRLRANDGNVSKHFIGRPDGTLTWGGSNVVTNTTVHDLLTVETKTSSSATIAANGTNAFTISVSKSGYTPIGVMGYNVGGSGRSRANVFNCSLSSTTVTMEVWNQSTSSVTWTASADVLYVKNSI